MTYALQKQHTLADSQAGNWANVKATLEAKTIATDNPHAWRFKEIIAKFGLTDANTVADALQNRNDDLKNATAGAWQAMSSAGLSLNDAVAQSMIDALAVAESWPDEFRDSIKALGFTYKSLANNIEQTVEQYEADWKRGELESWWTSKLNGGINEALANGDSATLKTLLTTATGEL